MSSLIISYSLDRHDCNLTGWWRQTMVTRLWRLNGSEHKLVWITAGGGGLWMGASVTELPDFSYLWVQCYYSWKEWFTMTLQCIKKHYIQNLYTFGHITQSSSADVYTPVMEKQMFHYFEHFDLCFSMPVFFFLNGTVHPKMKNWL